ncbi:aldehyde dehydrogenase family protein [Candidatus Kaiserbacteria bacterium]|nr:aldehyde dehydrogenase family protein [Candidatus Kaiserbacteria bacterium]
MNRKNSGFSPFEPYTPLTFQEINAKAHALADFIESNREELRNILLSYESFEVVEDETDRTLDLLRHLEENSKYFRLRVGQVTAFLPRNQPLYTFACFVIVPALMASEVHFRVPRSMRHFLPQLMSFLDISNRFPNIVVSNQTRLEFLRTRSAIRMNPLTEETVPLTDVVIFTGSSSHANQLRHVFDARTLFISNGAGHNPVVVSSDADVGKAVESVLALQLYNQGQDCSAPNAALVHGDIFLAFRKALRESIRSVKVGQYRDKTTRVGPISEPKDLVRVLDLILDNQEFLDSSTPGIIRAGESILEPTMICKPLKLGGNYTEVFAPVFFIQEYEKDADLSVYFEDPRYALNAMFVTVYGSSRYIESMIDRSFGGKILQDRASILYDTHPHARGIERGTEPYGGYGPAASSISIHGKVMSKPTLPQRDIWEWIARPLLARKDLDAYRSGLVHYSVIHHKNVEKLLKLSQDTLYPHDMPTPVSATYVDLHALPKEKHRRYVEADEKHTYHLLQKPNAESVTRLQPSDIAHLRELRKLLRRRSSLTTEKFVELLYAIPKKSGHAKRDNHRRQLRFFQHIYQLLLGKKNGPRLAQFLKDIDLRAVQSLLDV